MNKYNLNNTIFKHFKYVSCILCIGLLSACGDEKQDLEAWISQIKAKTVSKTVNVPELKEYINLPYSSANMVSPFQKNRVVNAALETPPDGYRNKEPLEAVALENVIFVGLIKQNKALKGMLKVEGKVYQVSIGNHVGQNYGKIMAIKDDGIIIKELIKDGENKWTEKIVTLPLHEGA